MRTSSSYCYLYQVLPRSEPVLQKHIGNTLSRTQKMQRGKDADPEGVVHDIRSDVVPESSQKY
jgi:hypothetical protein